MKFDLDAVACTTAVLHEWGSPEAKEEFQRTGDGLARTDVAVRPIVEASEDVVGLVASLCAMLAVSLDVDSSRHGTTPYDQLQAIALNFQPE